MPLIDIQIPIAISNGPFLRTRMVAPTGGAEINECLAAVDQLLSCGHVGCSLHRYSIRSVLDQEPQIFS
jgi:hypothetical protein